MDNFFMKTSTSQSYRKEMDCNPRNQITKIEGEKLKIRILQDSLKNMVALRFRFMGLCYVYLWVYGLCL